MCTQAIVAAFPQSVCFCLLELLLWVEKTPHPSSVKSWDWYVVMKYVFVYCLGPVRLIMFLTSFFPCLLELEASKYIICLVFASGFWCCSWDLAVWMLPVGDAGQLRLETWCLQGWWFPAASQRLSDHDATAPWQPGWLLRLWQVSGATWDPLHGLSTLPAHQGASLAALPPWEFSSKAWHFLQPLHVGAKDKRINGNVTLL